ncbi:phage antirepressor KilAC domain-containing protein [Acinetobacter guillouiae]|uniref:phage antirepressor KilAC domain-containing protein n=1 Tax=Acinetobacter guillouiae TaxID=106649 RepID=UPI002FD9F476
MNSLINLHIASMTSLEIAELVNKRHDNVKRTIESLVNTGVIVQPQIEDGIKSANGVIPQLYRFSGEQGKLDSITVVAQLCPEFTAALVKRWYELENQKPRELTRLEILQIALQAEQENQVLHEKVEILEPKAKALDTIANTEGTYNIRECAKTIGIGERKLVDLLLKKKWIYREESGRLQPYATKRAEGIFINRPSPVVTNKYTGEEQVHLHMRITAYGLTKIAELVNIFFSEEVEA